MRKRKLGLDFKKMVQLNKSNGQEKYYFWDESNRLRVTADENGMQHYIYDASGERILKGSSDFEALYESGSPVNGSGLVFLTPTKCTQAPFL